MKHNIIVIQNSRQNKIHEKNHLQVIKIVFFQSCQK